MFTVILTNSTDCELDRKTGESVEDILRRYADEDCLAGGDTLHIIDHDA